MKPGPVQIDRLDLMVGDSCAACGAPRRALNGQPLALGAKCVVCDSRSIRVPRKPGQVRGDVIEFPEPVL